jgi:hypothetical protein
VAGSASFRGLHAPTCRIAVDDGRFRMVTDRYDVICLARRYVG